MFDIWPHKVWLSLNQIAWAWGYERALTRNFRLSKEIKYIAEHTAVCLIDLCISAYCAGYSCKFFALNIEDFTPKASGSSEYSCFILIVLTFRKPVTDITHGLFPFFCRTYLKNKISVQGKARDGEKAEHTRSM